MIYDMITTAVKVSTNEGKTQQRGSGTDKFGKYALSDELRKKVE